MTAVEPAGMQGLSAGSTVMLVVALVVLVVVELAGRGSFEMAMEMAGPQ